MHYASTQEPPPSDEERQIEEEVLQSGAYIDIENEDETLLEGEAISGLGTRCKVVHGHSDRRSKKEGRSSKLLHLDDALEAWTKSLSAKTEASLAKASRMRNQEGSSSEPYSIDSCMDALEAMGDVTNEAYIEACKMFVLPEWRNMFMKMSEERKRAWMNGLK